VRPRPGKRSASTAKRPRARDAQNKEPYAPPSTRIVAPVVKLAAGDARYRAAPTISSGRPARRSADERCRLPGQRAVVWIARALLYRRIDSVARLTKILWAGMIVTVLVVIIAASTHFNAHLAFALPAGAFSLSAKFFGGLGAGLVLAIYDYFGYYTITYVGDEVRDPGRVVPWSIILSILGGSLAQAGPWFIAADGGPARPATRSAPHARRRPGTR
jgi:hypothetical protein